MRRAGLVRPVVRPVVSALLALTLGLAGAAACDQDAADRDDTGPITFSSLADLTRGHQIKAAVDRWNMTHPGEHVTHVEQSESADQQRSQLVAAAQGSGECYDVHSLDVVWTAEFARGGYAVPLGKRESKRYGIREEDFLPAAWESGRYDDVQWAVPFLANAPLLYYRKDVLRDEKISPPSSLGDMVETVETIDRRRAARGEDAISGFVGQFARYEGLTVNVLEIIRGRGGDLVPGDGRDAVVEPATVVAALQLLADGFRDGWIPAAARGYHEQGSLDAFRNGGALFMRNWPYAYKQLTGADSGAEGAVAAEDVGVVPLPWSPVPGGHNLVVSPCAAHRDTAWRFIHFLAADRRTQTELFDDGGYPAALAAVYQGRQDEFSRAVLASLERARPRPVSPYYGAVSRTIQDAVYDVLTHHRSPDDALQILKQSLPTVIKGG
jgi:multiple sugar transport system substrate-binding protein